MGSKMESSELTTSPIKGDKLYLLQLICSISMTLSHGVLGSEFWILGLRSGVRLFDCK